MNTLEKLRAEYLARRKKFFPDSAQVVAFGVPKNPPQPQAEPILTEQPEWPKHHVGKLLTQRDVVCAVSDEFEIDVSDILSPNKQTRIVTARMVAMYICYVAISGNLSAIGRHFKRDHATVLHAIDRIAIALCDDGDIAIKTRKLLKQYNLTELDR